MSERLEISERRACRLVELSRTVLHYEPKMSEQNAELTSRIAELAAARRRLFGLPRPELPSIAVFRAWGARGLSILRKARTIVLPGWTGPRDRPPARLLFALKAAHDRGARLMSICSGAFVLGYAGLLDGKRATTHWRYTDQFRSLFPRVELVPDVLYVDEGQIITSAGSAAGIDAGLHLIRRDFDKIVVALARELSGFVWAIDQSVKPQRANISLIDHRSRWPRRVPYPAIELHDLLTARAGQRPTSSPLTTKAISTFAITRTDRRAQRR